MNNKIQKLLEESGIISHHKAAKILKDNGWQVLVGSYYYDGSSSKTREIDIIAEKDFEISDSGEHLRVQLFIECKYIDQEIIFFFDNKDMEKALDLVESSTGLEVVANNHRNSGDVSIDGHHYVAAQQAAKLFTTNTNKDDVIFKASSQCLNAMIYNKLSSITSNGSTIRPKKIIKYPIVACDNFINLLEVDLSKEPHDVKPINKDFQLEVNYSYPANNVYIANKYFLVDIVDLNNIGVFTESLEEKEFFYIKRALLDDIKEENFNTRKKINRGR